MPLVQARDRVELLYLQAGKGHADKIFFFHKLGLQLQDSAHLLYTLLVIFRRNYAIYSPVKLNFYHQHCIYKINTPVNIMMFPQTSNIL